MSAPSLKTCRFCGMSNYEYKHPAARSAWVKYGTRHSAHLQCAVEKLAPPLSSTVLTRWQVEQLPFMEIRALGIEDQVRAKLAPKEVASV